MKTLIAFLMIVMAQQAQALEPFDTRIAQPHPISWMRPDHRALLGFGIGSLAVTQMFREDGDKQKHFWAGFASSFGIGMIFQPSDGWIVGVSLGAAKELRDRSGKGEPDWDDFGATVGGATAATGLIYLIGEING